MQILFCIVSFPFFLYVLFVYSIFNVCSCYCFFFSLPKKEIGLVCFNVSLSLSLLLLQQRDLSGALTGSAPT